MTAAFEDRIIGPVSRNGRLWLERPDRDAPVAVTPRYLRPLTGRAEIVFLDDKDREVVTIRSIDALQGEGRRLVETALQRRYHLAVIRRVDRLEVRMGTRYWHVVTDRGPRAFALREPGKNVSWLSDHHIVLRDTAGNRFEIPDLRALDPRSRRLVLRFT